MLRPVSELERQTWNAFIATHPRGHILQSWEWGELKAYSGWSPVRLALFNGERIVAAAQVLRRTAPHLPLRVGHLAYIPKGPVIDWSDAALCDIFLSALNAYLKRQGALALQCEVNVETDEAVYSSLDARLSSWQRVHSIQPLRTILLDLVPDEATLLAQMKEKWRYNVRLATRKGVSVRVAETGDDVRTWYRLLQTTGERDSFGIHTLDYYLRAWQLFVNQQNQQNQQTDSSQPTQPQAQLFLAEHEGQVLAGIFVSFFARQGIYLYGASSNAQRHLMPNYLLQWEAIRRAKQVGMTSYDFWGIPETDADDEAMAGVYRFKRGWGGRVVQFAGGYERIYHPIPMKLAKKLVAL